MTSLHILISARKFQLRCLLFQNGKGADEWHSMNGERSEWFIVSDVKRAFIQVDLDNW